MRSSACRTVHAAPVAQRVQPIRPAAGRAAARPIACRRRCALLAAAPAECAAAVDPVRSGDSNSAHSTSANSTSLPAGAPPASQLQRWHAGARGLVRLSTLVTAADVAVRAAAHAAAGGPALAASDAWVPLASSFTSFLILSSVFIVDGEAEAAACYATGLAGSLALLLQAWMLGAAPMPVAAVALLLAGGAAATNAVLLGSGALLTAPRAAAAWRLWRGVLGAVGFAMLPQVLYMSTLLPASGSAPGAAGSASWAPAAVGLSLFAALALALRAGRLPRSCWEVWDAPAWAATLLFMLEPLTVLAAAARDPASLAAASPAAFLLPALVTGLQVPRALLARDHMWTTGTSWSTAFVCLLAALAAAASGQGALAASVLAAPLLGGFCLLHGIAAAKRHASPLCALQPIAAVYQQQLRPWQQLAARLRSSARQRRAAT